MSSANSISSSQKSGANRSKSCDTVCTSNSSCYLQKRKPPNPLSYSLRTNLTRTTNSSSSVRQRVFSAKLLKLRAVQNKLNDANFHLSELARENQVLKTLQKRQDKALSKYENTNADLPRILHSHEEEIRILTEKNKTLKKNLKEVTQQLKNKEDELNSAREQIKHYEKLDKDKRLTENEKLADEIDNLNFKLERADEQISLLNRKLILESKSSKQKLNAEILKHKQCQRELNQALNDLTKLTSLLETKENVKATTKNRLSRMPNRQFVSLTSLSGGQIHKIDLPPTSEEKTPVSDVKLEPIQCKQQVEDDRKSNGILKMPSEIIRNRLGSSSKLTENEENSTKKNSSSTNSSRPNSSQRLSKMADNLKDAIDKAVENGRNEFDVKLGEYCAQVINNVNTCSEVINDHKESFKASKKTTDSLMNMFEDTKKLESKLKDKLISKENNIDFVDEILSEEFKFQSQFNGSGKESHVKLEEKKKLLAALKAIDNGDSVESVSEKEEQPNQLMKELFGGVYDK